MDMSTTWVVLALAIVVAAVLWKVRSMVRTNPVPEEIKPGRPLPEFAAANEKGEPVHSSELAGSPAVLLFVRGSWCPFCSRQVADLTRYYKEITDSGARLILVTPKPLETTRRVADFFEVDFEFWLDESLNVARQLGLVQPAGVPKEFQNEYGEDTMWPTSLVVDADGTIRLTVLSRFIADRPDPEKLLKAVRNL